MYLPLVQNGRQFMGIAARTSGDPMAITQAVRKIPIQHAKRMVGRKMYGGTSTHLPLRVNYSGVMPITILG